MKKNIIALFLIAVMAISVFGAVDLTTATKAQAATPTVTTLYTSAPFVKIGFGIAVYGTVKTSTGASVARGSVALYHWSATTGWVNFGSVPVTAGSFRGYDTQYNPGIYYYQAKYLGGSVYGQQYSPSTSAAKSTIWKYATTLSIGAFNYPTFNFVDGSLKDSYGRGVANQKVYIYRFSSLTSNRWVLWTTVTTDQNGGWRASDYLSSAYRTNYYAQFYETLTYFGSRTSVTPGV